MAISVVMSAYKRASQLDHTLQSILIQTRKVDQIVVVEDGFDDGETENVCNRWKSSGLPVEYYCRRSRPDVLFSNPARINNIGIRKAKGDILILQCAEVMYESDKDIENLVAPVESNPGLSTVALVKSHDASGRFIEWLIGPRLLNFCQAIHRDHVMKIRGFDEQYEGNAPDDEDFENRLRNSGVTVRHANDVVTIHQYHGDRDKPYREGLEIKKNFERLQVTRDTSIYEANVGKEWGQLSNGC